MILPDGRTKCSYPGCRRVAKFVAAGRGERWEREPGLFCDVHAGMVEQEGGPEYLVTCPNCGCRFGVG